MTFGSLVDDLKRYAERGGVLDEDVAIQIPRIINNTERDLADEMKILGYLDSYVSKMKIGQPRISKPGNWRSTVSINFGTGVDMRRRKSLRLRSYEYVRALYPDDSQLGEPEFVADYTNKIWLVKPSPNNEFPFEAMIWKLPDLLSESNKANYLTEMVPNLLLYRSLQGLAIYLKDPASAGLWKGFADERKAAVTEQDFKRMTDRAQVRSTA
jgi:hypothetical protein